MNNLISDILIYLVKKILNMLINKTNELGLLNAQGHSDGKNLCISRQY